MEKESTSKHSLLDLVNAFIPYIDKARLKNLSDLIVPKLNVSMKGCSSSNQELLIFNTDLLNKISQNMQIWHKVCT
jgi:hypothetical protein